MPEFRQGWPSLCFHKSAELDIHSMDMTITSSSYLTLSENTYYCQTICCMYGAWKEVPVPEQLWWARWCWIQSWRVLGLRVFHPTTAAPVQMQSPMWNKVSAMCSTCSSVLENTRLDSWPRCQPHFYHSWKWGRRWQQKVWPKRKGCSPFGGL